jgi:hypothetical protein
VRVVLSIAGKSGSILPENSLEHLRSNRVLVHIPHFIDELSVGHDKATFSSQWVLLLKVVDKRESAFKEELRKFVGVTQTLQA